MYRWTLAKRRPARYVLGMATLLDTLLARWFLAALIASLALLGIAHAFEAFGHLEPCHLCLQQRDAYWSAASVALVGLLIRRFAPGWKLTPWLEALLVLCFLAAAAIAVQQAGAEWKWWPAPEGCSGATTVTAADIARAMMGNMTRAPRCDEAAWRWLGLSMAGWDAVAALGLAGLSALAAVRSFRKG